MKRSAGADYLGVLACLLVLGSCVVDVAGAPCETDDNCPAGQYCSAAGTCALGEGGGRDAGSRDEGTTDGGAQDAETPDEGADANDFDGGDGGRDGGDAGRDAGDGGRDGGDAGACKDECPAKGSAECSAGGVHSCGDLDQDGCLEWGAVTPCAFGCESGKCKACQPDCAVKAKECGNDGCGGSCGDCTKPPAPACVDTKTLRTYNSAGSCSGATSKCTYGYTDSRCLYQCTAGKCADNSLTRAFVTPVDDRYLSVSAGASGETFACGTTVLGPFEGRAGLLTKFDPAGQVEWHRVLGDDKDDEFNSVAATPDGGAVVAGSTASFGVSGRDGWVAKFKSDGAVEWQYRFGGPNDDDFRAVETTADGGYVLAGGTNSWGTGRSDLWIVKLKSNGAIAWERVYGGTDDDAAAAVAWTSDGGLVAAGRTASFGAGYKDVYVIKVKADGAIDWQKAYGGGGDDEAGGIVQTADHGYAVVGSTDSFDPGKGREVFGLRLDAVGALTWASTAGGSGDDEGFAIAQTADQGFAVAGSTASFGAGSYDAWVLRYKTDGQLTGQRAYGGTAADRVYDLALLPSGDAVLAGESSSFGPGNPDAWVMRLNPDGSIGPDCPAGFASDTEAATAKPAVTVTAATGTAGSSYSSFGATAAPAESFMNIATDPCAQNP